jgi:hypothetical protein
MVKKEINNSALVMKFRHAQNAWHRQNGRARGLGKERGNSTQKAFHGLEQLNFSSVGIKAFGVCGRKT